MSKRSKGIIHKINPIPYKRRIKELFFDYIVILVYLAMLFCVSMSMYLFVLQGVPQFTQLQSQLIAAFTSIIPIILIFSCLDYFKDGSIGKARAGLKLVYEQKTFMASLTRNIIKFLPWQLGHMGTVRGIYTGYDFLAILLSITSVLLALVLVAMTFSRIDKRHLGDFISKTQVQISD